MENKQLRHPAGGFPPHVCQEPEVETPTPPVETPEPKKETKDK